MMLQGFEFFSDVACKDTYQIVLNRGPTKAFLFCSRVENGYRRGYKNINDC
jgi:hypothetical protein